MPGKAPINYSCTFKKNLPELVAFINYCDDIIFRLTVMVIPWCFSYRI